MTENAHRFDDLIRFDVILSVSSMLQFETLTSVRTVRLFGGEVQVGGYNSLSKQYLLDP